MLKLRDQKWELRKPAPEGSCLLSASLGCNCDDTVEINRVGHGLSQVFVACRFLLRIECKICQGTSVVGNQIQVWVILDGSKLDVGRFGTDVNLTVLERNQTGGILRNIAESKGFCIGRA